jgi:hypothetical protein
MNDLERYFRTNTGRCIDKWLHYFEIYDRHFSRFRGKEITLLEIGVFQGGSLQMWRNYFGDKAKIIGLDINPKCRELEKEGFTIFIGSQSDRKFLKDLRNKLPRLDILIDDGGHTMRQQIVTYEELFDHINEEGIYLCEDLHTSYFLEQGGGHKRRGTFIEYSKNLIDKLNAYHSEQRSLQVTPFTKSVDSIHYYDSIIVIEKKKKEKPARELTGNMLIQNAPKEIGKLRKMAGFCYRLSLRILNRFLRLFRIRGFIWR